MLAEIDGMLARLGRSEASLRLRIGEALVALAASMGHHELGFSSIKAYVLERCERADWWGGEARSLARRLQALGGREPSKIRAAVMEGSMLWSMAKLLGEHATPEDEAELVAQARGRTVADMKAWLAARAGSKGEQEPESQSKSKSKSKGKPKLEPGPKLAPEPEPTAVDDDETSPQTVRIRVGKEELLVIEAARMLIEMLDGARPTDEHFLTALIGEGQSALADLAGRRIALLQVPELDPERLQAWREHLRALRARREAQATGNIPVVETLPIESEDDGPLPTSPRELDEEIRRLCSQLARRDLELGRLAGSLFHARGWARLGYASAEQYARERVGVSLSSLRQRINLARQVDALPAVAEALEHGTIGFEAARLVVRVATPDNVEAWIARAAARTVVHLREEVDSVEFRARFQEDAPYDPPSDRDLEDTAAVERDIQSGETLARALKDKPPGQQISLVAGAGCELRLKVSAELWAEFERLGQRFRRIAPPKASFVAFLGLSLWEAWLPQLEREPGKWHDVHHRDRYRCRSPVCNRHDVTLHHLQFRSHGGGDEDENLVSLCSWCHLEGIHQGRLEATPPASNIHWTVGREPVMVVHGRERRLVAGC